MKNIDEQEILNIELDEFCNKYQIENYLAEVNNLYNETNYRIWFYLETGTMNHQIDVIKKYLKTVEQLEKIKRGIWKVTSETIKHGHINYFPQYEELKNQYLKLLNL